MGRHFIKILFVLILNIFFGVHLHATHNRAGEITYEQIDALTIRATITTYTKASSISADRDTLELFWGDGNSTLVPRFNGNGEIIPGQDIKINYYIAEHTYPGRASYTLSFVDPNRVDNIQNVNFPNSVDVRFYVQTTFTFINSQFEGLNNSVRLLQAPIDFACVNQKFIHNPNAYDPDGDSLSFELIVPLENEGMDVPNYEYPDQIFPGIDNQISLDPVTGDFVWDTPKAPGEYNIAIKINEYRKGVLLNSVIRDMQIFVDICDNQLPEIQVEEELCVIAGTPISLPITVTDPDDNQLVRLTVTGGPFLLSTSRAELVGGDIYTVQDLKATLNWDTKCEHISSSYYQIVLRAEDNSNGNSGLSILKTVRIKIVGPPPENLTGASIDDQIELKWDLDYACKKTDNDYFLGFSVWRRENTNPFAIDSCREGLDGRGYEVIEFNTLDSIGSNYVYTDDFNLEKGKIYCYRILANFALRTPSGNPYNLTESLPSDEICLQLNQDIPLITKVSVASTDNNNGQMDIEWIKPLVGDFDTLAYPGPYEYRVMRSENGLDYALANGGVINHPFFNSTTPLIFQDNGLNTSDLQYYYRIDFFSQGQFYSSSKEASSVYAEVYSSDKQNQIEWREFVPWNNYTYTIYQDNSGTLDSIGTSITPSFIHFNLENDIEYCYVVESQGTYGLSSTPSVLLNFSQKNCGIPLDSVGPCAPILSVNSPCNNGETGTTPDEFENQLSWRISALACDNADDLAGYIVYYAESESSEFEIVFETDDPNQTEITHQPFEGISGCYAVSSVDSLGNVGPLSEKVCIQNCPIYILPNTFTPNNDGSNDLFTPIENRFVLSVDFQVFNRWGNQIYRTNDSELNWTGTDEQGSELAEGTYYYTCKVFELKLDGSSSQSAYLNGSIQLIR